MIVASRNLYLRCISIVPLLDFHRPPVGRQSGVFRKFRFWWIQAAQLVHQFNQHWNYTSSWCTGLLVTAEASVSQLQLHRTYCLHLPLKFTLREFSPFVGCWHQDGVTEWTSYSKCALVWNLTRVYLKKVDLRICSMEFAECWLLNIDNKLFVSAKWC